MTMTREDVQNLLLLLNSKFVEAEIVLGLRTKLLDILKMANAPEAPMTALAG